MQLLKIATAATVKIGPFVDDTDGKTAETGLTIAQADIRLSKNGGAFAQAHNAAGATHDENGYYDVPLDTTDTDTVGRLRVSVSVAGALPVWQDFMVVPANVYDSIVLGTDLLDVTAYEVNDKTGYSLADGAITAAKIATGAIDADAIAADAVTKVQAGLSTLTAQQVADATKLAPSPGDADPGSLKAQVDACVSQASSAASYSELVNSRLPASPAAVGSAMTLADGAITAAKIASDAISAAKIAADAVTKIQSGLSTFDPTTDTVANVTHVASCGNVSEVGHLGQEAIGADAFSQDALTVIQTVNTNNDKSGYTLSASGVQAIWEYASRSLTTFGTLVSDIATAVWSAVTRTITGGSLTTSPPTAAQIADAVWDETLADHAGAGSTGAALSGATAPTAAAIADAVWDEAIAEHATAGSTGKLLQNADVATSTRATPAQVKAECAAALADYDPPTKAEMDAGLAGITVSLSSSDIESIASLIQVDPQLVRDALAIDLTDGKTPTSGSIDKLLELIKNSTDRLAAGGITFQNAVDARGNMKLYAGQTYAGGTIVSVGRTGWTGPNLNGLAGTMVVQTLANYKKNTRIPDHEFPGVTFVQVGNDVTANVELTDEDSSLLWPANGKPEFWYQILYRAGGTTYVVAEGPMLTKKVIESNES